MKFEISNLKPQIIMEWTESQLRAIETRGRRVLVSAGAGSGKTRVLVERFLQLLEENPAWRVADIVAVTFTEKAAREMVSRIRREIRARIQRSPAAEERRRWREHRNALDSARIGTIHSLCAAILRAHPAEAALDPAFEVIEEIEGAALLDQAVNDALDEVARNYSDSKDAAEVFAYLSAYDVRASLWSLVAQGERARQAVSKLSRLAAKEILAFWQDSLDRVRREAADSLVERESWRRDAEAVMTITARDRSDKREQCRQKVAELLAASDRSEGDERIRALLDIPEQINLRLGSKSKWGSEEEFKMLGEALRRIREAVRGERLLALALNEADEAAARAVRSLVDLYERSRERFARLKQERAALDFNDLEEITERMLSSHGEVCDRYTDAERGLIRALMIDEFQDTSPIQKRILWMIAPRSGELFIIGDAKQSIYRFRGADVTVFHEAREELEASSVTISLDRCFRTHDKLVSFSNHIFQSIFARESRYDMRYEAMSAHRQVAHGAPAVEIHVVSQESEAEERWNIEQLRKAEAALIARRIEEIIAGEARMICDEQGQPRAAEYGDFALLFQASTNFETYEQALASRDIPYVTLAGRGFYDRQEIIDLTNLLGFLSSPIDSLRLAAALRSPLFSLSDETLFRLRLKHQPLWDSLCDEGATAMGAEREAVEFARETLKALRALVGRVGAADIIIAALRETGYLATLMALPYGERRVANIEKFIEQARALSSMTLSEIVERLAHLKIREAREGEATVEEAGAVRLMTVHKSKGLEFPIVWIADATYAGARNTAAVAAHTDLGIGVDVRLDTDDPTEEPIQAGSFEMMRLVEQRMEQAEKKRLLYVAATRARDHLIVSGATSSGKISDTHWLGKIISALGANQIDAPGAIDYPGGQALVMRHDAQRIYEKDYKKGASQPSSLAEREEMIEARIDSRRAANAFPLIRPLA